MEEWRPVIGWEGKFSVSNEGRVRNDKTGYIKHPSLAGEPAHPYYSVRFYTGKGQKNFQPMVHVVLRCCTGG